MLPKFKAYQSKASRWWAGEGDLIDHRQITIFGGEIGREGLKRLLVDRGFDARSCPWTQVDSCITTLTDSADETVIVDAPTISAGIGVCLSIRARRSDVRLILMSDDLFADDYVDDPPDGIDEVVARSMSLERLCEILGRADAGPEAKPSNGISHDLRAALPGSDIIGEPLSTREIEIMFCLANGDANKVIARRLGITEATVKVHVKTILRKLGLANRTQAAIWALKHGYFWQPGGEDQIADS